MEVCAGRSRVLRPCTAISALSKTLSRDHFYTLVICLFSLVNLCIIMGITTKRHGAGIWKITTDVLEYSKNVTLKRFPLLGKNREITQIFTSDVSPGIPRNMSASCLRHGRRECLNNTLDEPERVHPPQSGNMSTFSNLIFVFL